MPRAARIVYDGGLFHVFARGNNKNYIFRMERDFRIFKKLLLKYKILYDNLIYHYTLMKNHIHLIVRIDKGMDLAKMMHGVGLSYALHYKRKYRHVGHFWQDRFKSPPITENRYLLTCGLYIERNPVDSGLVKAPEDYPWSSYKVYAHGQEDPLVEIDPIYQTLGRNTWERQIAYRKLMEETISARTEGGKDEVTTVVKLEG